MNYEYALTSSLNIQLTEEEKVKIDAGQLLQAIQEIRRRTGTGLMEAKIVAEAYKQHGDAYKYHTFEQRAVDVIKKYFEQEVERSMRLLMAGNTFRDDKRAKHIIKLAMLSIMNTTLRLE